jgi:hypothetical protein
MRLDILHQVEAIGLVAESQYHTIIILLLQLEMDQYDEKCGSMLIVMA